MIVATLQFEYQIKYKLCHMVYKILNNSTLQYFSDLFYGYKPLCKNCRSENDHSMINTEPHIEKKTIFPKICVT